MAYTTIDKPNEYFTTTVYTGNGSTLSISSLEFSPDFVWIKNRNIVSNHVLFDTVRGTTLSLESESTASESIRSGITSFDSNGFTLGSNGNSNANGNSHASWSWRGSDSSAVSNTAGSITSTVSANTTSGFSIVSWSGNSTAGATIGHGLGVAPKMIIVKDRDGADSWVVYHNSLAITEYLILNGTLAALTDNEVIFYDTDPTSSVFTVGAHNTVNQPGHNYIAYCFAEKKGFSKFGSYIGNGSADGTFVYTGFKPAWVLAKRTNDSSGWVLFDNKREPFNLADTSIRVDDSGAENQSNGALDFLSNGFKWRTTDTGVNGSGNSFIFMAFAEHPFVTSTSIPTTAR